MSDLFRVELVDSASIRWVRENQCPHDAGQVDCYYDGELERRYCPSCLHDLPLPERVADRLFMREFADRLLAGRQGGQG